MICLTSQDLSNLTSSQLFDKLDELKGEAITLCHEMTDAERAYKDEKELLPIILAEIQSDHMNTHGTGVTEAGVFAKAHKTYKEKVQRATTLGHQYREKEAAFKVVMESIKALTSIGWVRVQEHKLARE